MNILYGTIPILAGIVLDCILGDPYRLPHPVRLMGKLIAFLERLIRKKNVKNITDKEAAKSSQRAITNNVKEMDYTKEMGEIIERGSVAEAAALTASDAKNKSDFFKGMLLSIIVLILSTGIPLALLIIFYHINIVLGIAAESIMCYYMLAARCLNKESMKVYRAIEENNTEKARNAVSMIVGRDTDRLNREGIIKAAVETVAENTSDGVTAPLFYMAFGGGAAGFLYKAANTMDSMLGYKNDEYMYFGRFAAKLDDVLNFIPSRLTVLFMIWSAFILGYDGRNAFRIWRRDRRKHSSPNSAQTESACAGALNIMLGGDAWYFGKLVKKDTIGDALRAAENNDIKRANRLMYCTSFLMLAVIVMVRSIIGIALQ